MKNILGTIGFILVAITLIGAARDIMHSGFGSLFDASTMEVFGGNIGRLFWIIIGSYLIYSSLKRSPEKS